MQYEWQDAMGLADYVLREVVEVSSIKYSPPYGFIMKSSPTTYVAWVPNDAGNRMEFFDVETAKAWVFTQVRMGDSNALITESA
jgi:hypothetical protein